MPRTPAEPPVGTGTARERLLELAETIGSEKLDRYQDVLARLEPRQLDPLVARLERAQSWGQIAKVVGQDSPDDARATVTEALCSFAAADGSDLEELAGAVADRSTIDWPAKLDQAKDEREREVLEQLRLADEVAEACWTQSTSPKRLGDFEILRELGRGGMGIVYEARQLSLNRRVALKVLPPALGLSSQATKRFEREARAAAKLHHTNIVPVHAIGEQDGHHFYAMDVIDGQSLDHILEDVSGGQANPLLEATVTRAAEELPEKTASPTTTGSETSSSTSLSDSAPGGRKWFDVAAKLVAEVAEALQYAHGRGIIHRDIKPANLMLSAEGYLCVTDFGLARMLQEPGMTVSGSLLGTPAYMSPEQIAAGRITVDHRTDIYSLGAVLYELLTLQRPFPGRSREEVLTAVMTRDPRPPRRFNGKIPVDLETICLKALEKDPQRRYRTAGELAQDLKRYLQGGLIQARRAGMIRRVSKSIRRHPTIAATAALAIVSAVVIGGVVWQLTSQRQTEVAKRCVSDARLAMNDGRNRDALAKLDEALSIDTDLDEARVMRARVLMDLNRPRDAYNEASQILEKDSEDWQGHLIMAGLARGGWDPVRNVPAIQLERHVEFVESQAPQSADAYYLRALITDSPREAIELLEQALDIEPHHFDAILEKIGRHQKLKDFPTALQLCDRLTLLRPHSSEPRRARAWLLRYSGDLLGAVEEMDRAVQINPRDPANYHHRGRAYWVLGQQEEAVDDYTRAIELEPDGAHHYWLLGSSFRLMGRFDEAVQAARRSIELDPNAPDSWKALLGAYFDSKQDAHVREVLGEFTAKATSWGDSSAQSEAHRVASFYYRHLGEADLAVAEADLAVELNPQSRDAVLERIRALKETGDAAGIEASCNALMSMSLDSENDASTRLAGTWLGPLCNRWDDAKLVLDRLVADFPRWHIAYYNRGAIHRSLGNLEAEIADQSKVIELAPHFAGGYGNRGDTYAQLGRIREALEDTRKALEYNPYADTYHENLVRLLIVTGQLGEAQTGSQELIERKPRLCSGYSLRAQILALMGQCDAAHEVVGRMTDCAPSPGLPGSVHYQLSSAELVFGYACPQFFDSAETVIHARDEQWPCAETLTQYGTALYLDGDHEAAKTQLHKAMELAGIERPQQLFVLSAIASKQGNSVLARDYFDRACEIMDRDEPNNPMLILQRREAARLLGIEVEDGAVAQRE